MLAEGRGAAVIAACLVPSATIVAHLTVGAWPAPAAGPLALGRGEHPVPSGLFGLSGWPAVAAGAATALLLLALLRRVNPRPSAAERLGLALLFAGAATNLTEAALRRSVMDWIWLSTDGTSALVWNSADMALLAGGLILLRSVFWAEAPRPRARRRRG